MKLLKCKHCGNEFHPRSGHHTTFCSEICRSRYWAKQQYHNPRPRQNTGKYAKQCAFCGKEFHTNHNGAKYCSRKCAANKRIDWVGVDILEIYDRLGSYNAVGRELGVSGSSVRKRILKVRRQGDNRYAVNVD